MTRQETRAYARRVVADVVLTVYINRRRHARCFNRKGLASASRRRETAPARRGLSSNCESLENCPSTRLRPTASKKFRRSPLTTAATATLLSLSTELRKMAKRLIPLLDRVLVEKIVAPTKSVGGIILPESAVSKVRLQEPHGTIAQSAPTNRRPKPPPSVHPTLTFPRLTSIVSAD